MYALKLIKKKICLLIPIMITLSFITIPFVYSDDNSSRYKDDSSYVFAPGYLNAAKYQAEAIADQHTQGEAKSLLQNIVDYVQGKTEAKVEQNAADKPKPALQQKQSSPKASSKTLTFNLAKYNVKIGDLQIGTGTNQAYDANKRLISETINGITNIYVGFTYAGTDTIAQAMAIAAAGNTIYVNANTYTENVAVKDGIKLYGMVDADGNKPVINGCVRMENITQPTEVAGFTINGGESTILMEVHGTWFDPVAKKVVTGERIESSTELRGIYINNDTGAIKIWGNTISASELIQGSPGLGVLIASLDNNGNWLLASPNVTLEDNIIRDNAVGVEMDGLGTGTLALQNNLFQDNWYTSINDNNVHPSPMNITVDSNAFYDLGEIMHFDMLSGCGAGDRSYVTNNVFYSTGTHNAQGFGDYNSTLTTISNNFFTTAMVEGSPSLGVGGINTVGTTAPGHFDPITGLFVADNSAIGYNLPTLSEYSKLSFSNNPIAAGAFSSWGSNEANFSLNYEPIVNNSNTTTMLAMNNGIYREKPEKIRNPKY